MRRLSDIDSPSVNDNKPHTRLALDSWCSVGGSKVVPTEGDDDDDEDTVDDRFESW